MSRSEVPKTEALSPGGMRHRQKNRTRRALLDAAAELMRQGREPTVAEVAEVAEVSRATAYRYFPTQESLLVEMRMFAPEGPLEMFDRVVLESGDPVERVGVLVREVSHWALQNETALRTLLRLSLDPETGVRRPGHRIRWIAEALKPLQGRVDGATLDRLSSALTMLLGIDPIIPLRDFAELPPTKATEVIEWAARMLVRSVVDDVALGTDARGARATQATLASHAAASPNVQLAPRRRQRVGKTKGT